MGGFGAGGGAGGAGFGAGGGAGGAGFGAGAGAGGAGFGAGGGAGGAGFGAGFRGYSNDDDDDNDNDNDNSLEVFRSGGRYYAFVNRRGRPVGRSSGIRGRRY